VLVEEEDMELGDNVAKKVKFSQRIISSESKPLTPLLQLKRSRKQDINKLILGVWLRLSEAGEYKLLEERLQEFGLNQEPKMYDYFRKEGPYLLRHSTLSQRNPEHLRFICEHVPEDLLRGVLRADNYSNIDGFLLGHTGMEKRGLIDEERLHERREKLNLLFKIDPEGLEEYVESKYFGTRFSTGVKASFQEAVAAYKAAKISIK
jgi:hypothetical protein